MLPHVTVCICTFQRPGFLRRLLDGLLEQSTSDLFTFGIVVCDNDPEKSAETIVSEIIQKAAIAISYCDEPRKNIALARNKALSEARGEFVAFLDDDEFPAPDWLRHLYEACQRYQSAGVLGPVRPHFEENPPNWILRGGFCERPEYPTARVMKWQESRTGNLIFRRAILEGDEQPFLEEFPNGGEDKDFFMRMNQRGHRFIWCNEAIAYETVPPSRWTRSYMLKRALLRGRNILKHPTGRAAMLTKSLFAIPIYSVVLPFTLLFGQHCFMKYCVRFCDHFGRILALIGANTVKRPV
jgi:succinoglycan biosynthesis protein ExoM